MHKLECPLSFTSFVMKFVGIKKYNLGIIYQSNPEYQNIRFINRINLQFTKCILMSKKNILHFIGIGEVKFIHNYM